MMANEINSTQVRLPAALYQSIQNEAARLGIANNAFLIILCEMGGKVWEQTKNPATADAAIPQG